MARTNNSVVSVVAVLSLAGAWVSGGCVDAQPGDQQVAEALGGTPPANPGFHRHGQSSNDRFVRDPKTKVRHDRAGRLRLGAAITKTSVSDGYYDIRVCGTIPGGGACGAPASLKVGTDFEVSGSGKIKAGTSGEVSVGVSLSLSVEVERDIPNPDPCSRLWVELCAPMQVRVWTETTRDLAGRVLSTRTYTTEDVQVGSTYVDGHPVPDPTCCPDAGVPTVDAGLDAGHPTTPGSDRTCMTASGELIACEGPIPDGPRVAEATFDLVRFFGAGRVNAYDALGMWERCELAAARNALGIELETVYVVDADGTTHEFDGGDTFECDMSTLPSQI